MTNKQLVFFSSTFALCILVLIFITGCSTIQKPHDKFRGFRYVEIYQSFIDEGLDVNKSHENAQAHCLNNPCIYG